MWALYCLANHPQAVEAIANEARLGDDPATMQPTPYLDAVIKELQFPLPKLS